MRPNFDYPWHPHCCRLKLPKPEILDLWQIIKKKKKKSIYQLQTNSRERVHAYAHAWTDRRQVKMITTAGGRLRQRWQLSPGFSGSGSAEAATDVPLNAPNVLVRRSINRSMKMKTIRWEERSRRSPRWNALCSKQIHSWTCCQENWFVGFLFVVFFFSGVRRGQHKLCVSWRVYDPERQQQQPAAGLSPRLLIESEGDDWLHSYQVIGLLLQTDGQCVYECSVCVPSSSLQDNQSIPRYGFNTHWSGSLLQRHEGRRTHTHAGTADWD